MRASARHGAGAAPASGEDGRTFPLYVPPVPRTWWLQSAAYRRFAARELTAVFVAAFSLILLRFLYALSQGRAAYEGFLRWLEEPGVLILHAVLLVAVLYHTFTWFRLTAHVQEIQVRDKRIRPTAALFGAWLIVSDIVALLHIAL